MRLALDLARFSTRKTMSGPTEVEANMSYPIPFDPDSSHGS